MYVHVCMLYYHSFTSVIIIYCIKLYITFHNNNNTHYYAQYKNIIHNNYYYYVQLYSRRLAHVCFPQSDRGERCILDDMTPIAGHTMEVVAS